MHLSQPPITEYFLLQKGADGKTKRVYRTGGQRVKKNTPGARKERRRSKKWYGEYTDANGKPQRVPLAEGKAKARAMLAQLVSEAESARASAGDPLARHRGKSFADHLGDYESYLKAKGNTVKHVSKTVRRCAAVLAGIAADDLGDVQPSAVVEFLATLRTGTPPPVALPEGKEWFTKKELVVALDINPASVARMMRRANLEGLGQGKARRYPRAAIELLQERCCRGLGIATSNHYLTAIKGFTRWLTRNGRALTDPLTYLPRMNPDTDIRLERRALAAPEFAALIEAARRGKPFRGLSGPARALLYHTAAHTGLRASELASLTAGSFDANARTLTVQAAYSKRRRKDVILLRPDLAELLAAGVEGEPRAAHLWPGTWPECGAEMIRLDLAAAGIAFMDEDGRVYDFHALRHQFISDLVAAGVHPKVAQTLARHSTITLTLDRYSHVSLSDQAAALDKLPGIAGKEPDRQASPTSRRTKDRTA